MSVWIHRVNFMWNTHRKIERCHWTLVDRKRIQHGGRQKDLVTERWGDSGPVLDLVVWAWSAWLYRQFVLFSPSNQTCCKVFIMLFPWLEREKKERLLVYPVSSRSVVSLWLHSVRAHETRAQWAQMPHEWRKRNNSAANQRKTTSGGNVELMRRNCAGAHVEKGAHYYPCDCEWQGLGDSTSMPHHKWSGGVVWR